MRNNYWRKRMEKWGMWHEGIRGVQISPLVRAMNGTPRSTNTDNAPRDYSEERETDELVRCLPQELRSLAMQAYPGRARLAQELGMSEAALLSLLDTLHRNMARMLDQRRRGDEIDPSKRRQRVKISMVKINNRRAAACAE
jgi:hypothetical protein